MLSIPLTIGWLTNSLGRGSAVWLGARSQMAKAGDRRLAIVLNLGFELVKGVKLLFGAEEIGQVDHHRPSQTSELPPRLGCR